MEKLLVLNLNLDGGAGLGGEGEEGDASDGGGDGADHPAVDGGSFCHEAVLAEERAGTATFPLADVGVALGASGVALAAKALLGGGAFMDELLLEVKGDDGGESVPDDHDTVGGAALSVAGLVVTWYSMKNLPASARWMAPV